MGQEIHGERFSKRDFDAFRRRLEQETALLESWFAEGRFSERHSIGGFELEAWLVDGKNRPAPVNDRLLPLLDEALVTPELSRFNIELNSTPRVLEGAVFDRMAEELEGNWRRCREAAARLGVDLVMTGILPTVEESELTLENMSGMVRYRALNEQVLRLRAGRPLTLDIQGIEHLHTQHRDVMLEAATTSFQIHLQLDQARAARYFNAAVLLSGPMVAATANAPFLFGKRLWRETRIPLFERAVDVGGMEGAAFGPVKRVTFGTGYVRRSLFELFRENVEHYPVLLPAQLDAPVEELPHLRLHNGTIWRWNRPLVGFDEDGTPHLRVEHRVVPAGPTVADSIANAALFFGLVHALAGEREPPEQRLEFAAARENLYAAAKHSLDARLTWLDGKNGNAAELFRERLLPLARRGLRDLAVNGADIERYLGIIEERVRTRQTGAEWQIRYLDRHGCDFNALVGAYRERQVRGRPVHEWGYE
ncbi:MAG TPA: glutamate--cysteine ligase [Gammaproteobacteria bacterium]|nr:glutamate--cysteine ligase [Gammaproteobacteria bacterium]